MVIGLLITLDWNIFHIYFLLMLPVILQGHSLQLMDSKLETSKTPTLSSDIHAPCLRHRLLYFKFRRNRDLLDLFFPSRLSFFVPWAFLEAGWVFLCICGLIFQSPGANFAIMKMKIVAVPPKPSLPYCNPVSRDAGRQRRGNNCICIWDSFCQILASTWTYCCSVYL